MDMSEHASFFNHTTDEQFFASLDSVQKAGLDDFYHAHANTTYRERYNKNIDRNGKKIFMPQSMIGRTAHHTYVALYNNVYSRKVDDFDLQACRIDNNLQLEQYEIQTVDNSNPTRRIIRAEGQQTGHKASIIMEMGRQIVWMETFTINNHRLLLPLPIHPVKSSDILLPYHSH